MTVIKQLVAASSLPAVLTLILLLAALILKATGRPRASRITVATGVGWLLLAAWGPFADLLLAPLEQRHDPLLNAARHPQAAHVVVLGSSFRPEGHLPVTAQLGDSAVVRLVEGVRLYRQLSSAELLLTGGAAFAGAPAAYGYQTLALGLGVPAGAIRVFPDPLDTHQEARAVADYLPGGSTVILVTSASHMARAMRHFRAVGLDPVAAPTRHKVLAADREHPRYWLPAATHLRKTERAIYEYLGHVSYFLDRR